jgi:hypothetical protein
LFEFHSSHFNGKILSCQFIFKGRIPKTGTAQTDRGQSGERDGVARKHYTTLIRCSYPEEQEAGEERNNLKNNYDKYTIGPVCIVGKMWRAEVANDYI